jgi:hypothetical protein
LPDAAVATGTFAIAAKLPGFDGSVGTAAQPAPNSPVAVAGAIDGASAGAAEGAAAGAAAPAGAGTGAAAVPQADSATAQTEAAVTTANLRARMRIGSLREMGSEVLSTAAAAADMFGDGYGRTRRSRRVSSSTREDQQARGAAV